MKSFEELNNEFLLDSKFDDVENVKPEDYDEYLDEVNQILEVDNSNIEALKFKYYILFCQRKYDESIEICDLLLKNNPEDIEVLKFKEANLFQLNKYNECAQICKKILEISPKDKEILDEWKTVCVMSDDNDIPKPTKSLFSEILNIIIIISIFGVIIFYLYSTFIKGYF